MAREKSQGRTKACANCKRRKIKCDEKLPACSPCLKFNRECGGAVGGMVFVNTVDLPQKPKGKPRHQGARRKIQIGSSTGDSASSSPDSSLEDELGMLAIGNYTDDQNKIIVLPPARVPQEITRTNVFTQALIANWMRVCDIGGMSWICLLPGMLPGNQTLHVERGLVAASLAHYGEICDDKSAKMAARKLYGEELMRQRRRMIVLESGVVPSLEDVVIPIVLAFFELVEPTSPVGYFGHVIGAEKVLSLMGPERCASEDIDTIFQIVRSDNSYASMRRRKPSVFAQTEWMTKPYIGKPRTIFDRLGDVYVLLPDIMSRFDEIIASGHDAGKESLICDAEILLSEIDSVSNYITPNLMQDLRSSRLLSSTIAKSHAFLSASDCFMKVAFCIPKVYIFSMLCRLSPNSSYELQLKDYCHIIIQQSELVLGMVDIGRRGYMALGLSTVVISSPDSEQKKRAYKLLKAQEKTGGIEDYIGVMIINSIPYGELSAHLWDDVSTDVVPWEEDDKP